MGPEAAGPSPICWIWSRPDPEHPVLGADGEARTEVAAGAPSHDLKPAPARAAATEVATDGSKAPRGWNRVAFSHADTVSLFKP